MIREIQEKDLTYQYFMLLSELSGNVRHLEPIETWTLWSTYQNPTLVFKSNADRKTLVYEDDGKIIGTATAFIEHKFLHCGSRVGHIEDVVVDKNIRKSGIGKALIKECIEFCRYRMCYKAILDCSRENIPFYECCGFTFSENCMRINLGEK